VRACSSILAALTVACVFVADVVRADETSPPAAAQSGAAAANAPAAPPASPAPPSQDPAVTDACEVPSYLVSTDAKLARLAEAITERKRLDILVVGGASSILPGPDGASMSYPARLEAVLRERLSGVTVNVTTSLQAKKTAPEVAPGLDTLAKERKPTLVIWQTGTMDALKAVDPEDFRAAIDGGLEALKQAGSDVILMNLQYSPRMETMITVAPYLDNIRVGAEEHAVPLYDRFSIMRYWNESGRFDLFNTTRGFGLAKQVHDCVGHTLAAFVVDAAQVPTDEPRTQH